MSKHLLDYLQSQPNTDLGLEEYTDGEIKLEVHTASEASVDAVVGEMAEAEIEQTEIGRDCDRLVENQAAMEQYVDAMEKALADGGMNDHAAMFMRLGVERFEEMGLTTDAVPALEAFGGTASKRRSTEVALEAFKEIAKQAWEAIKAALKELWKSIQDVAVKALAGADRVRKRALELKGKVSSLPATPGTDTITVTNPGKLSANGEFDGTNVAMVRGLLEYGLNVFPEATLKYVADVAQAIRSIDPEKDELYASAKAIFAIEPLFSRFPGAEVSDVPPGFSSDAKLKKSDVVLGNKALFAGYPTGMSSVDSANPEDLRKMRSTFRVDLLTDPKAKAAPDSAEVTVLNKASLNTMLGQIVDTTKVISKGLDRRPAYRKAIDDLIAAGDALRDKASKVELNPGQRIVVEELLRSTQTIQKLLGQSISGLVTYGVTTLNAQVALAERMISAYATQPAASAATA